MPEPNGNGNGSARDPLAGLPWWVRAVVIVGVPSALALGLVWSNQTQLVQQVNTNGDVLLRVESAAVAHDNRVLARFQELSNATGETNRILTATCVNAAKSAEARERCVGR